MSNYIAFELDALNMVPDVANAAGLPAGDVAHGLLKLWAWCFRNETDVATTTHLLGFFGKPTAPALEAFGFLEPLDSTTWRVRGAERYLRVTAGRRKGGLAAKANLVPGGKRAAEAQPSGSRGQAETEPRLDLGLSPTTDDRAPTTEHRKEEAAPPPPPVAAFEIVPPDFEKIESWQKEDFWRAAEITRRSRGYPPQKWPNPVTLSRWWGEARGMADVTTLAQAFTRFADDPHWTSRNPPAPFAGFMTQWNSFLPRSA